MRQFLLKHKLMDMPFYILFFISPFAVSGTFQSIIPIIPTSTFIMAFVFVYCMLLFLSNKVYSLQPFEKNTALLFIVPIFLSFLGVLTGLFLINDNYYIDYVMSDLPFRMILVVVNITIFLSLLTVSKNWELTRFYRLTRKYYYALLLMALVAMWQLLHYLFNVPFINLDTRNHIHSVTGNFLVESRVTSLANEPSFLAPLIIDLIILSLLVSKKPIKIIVLSLLVLLFTFSGGGYVNLFLLSPIILIGCLKYVGFSFKFKHLFIIFVLLFILTAFLIVRIDDFEKLMSPVLGRLDIMFKPETSSRAYMSLMPFVWAFDTSIINALFGHGPSAYNYLMSTKLLPNGNEVHATSNNLFGDRVFELGYIGVISYLLIFIRFIWKSFTNLYGNRYNLIAFILTSHLLISSLYRADFMQPRFWILIFIIMFLIRIGNSKNQHEHL